MLFCKIPINIWSIRLIFEIFELKFIEFVHIQLLSYHNVGFSNDEVVFIIGACIQDVIILIHIVLAVIGILILKLVLMYPLSKEIVYEHAVSIGHFELADLFEDYMQMWDADEFGVYLELAVWDETLDERNVDDHHFNQGLEWIVDSCSDQR